MNEKIKIILADDEELFRKGVLFLLQREENIEIIFEGSNGMEVLNYLENKKNIQPDIIMMDLKMPLLNGVEATKIIWKEFPNIKVIALTSYNTKSFIANMINVGASSYLVKSASPQEMIDTVNGVADKGFYYNENTMQVIKEDIVSGTQKSPLDSEFLTLREQEVLQLVCEQYNNAEIAEKLCISARTVEGHRNNILVKSGKRNLAGLVVFAIQNRIVTLDNLYIEK